MLMLHRQSSTTGGLSGALRTLAVYAVLGGLAPEARAQCPHATGNSPPTVCAEEDNINIPFTGNVSSFVVEATHPAYAVGVDSCLADFTNCPPPGGGYPFPPGVFVLFDDGITIVEAVREDSWWRPNGMLASADQGTPFTDIHYVRVYRKIAAADEWPQFFVLYMDGNLRLIPHPPAGRSSVCFGSSMVIGPAAPAPRPIAEITSVRYVSATKTMEVRYLAGGSAVLSLSEVDRTMARVRVAVNYAGSLPFATFRSMFVVSGNADVDRVSWNEPGGIPRDEAIMNFAGSDGTEFFFFRQTRPQHNTSAPDIRVRAMATGCRAQYYPVAPCRLLDTRNSEATYGGPALAGGAIRVFPLFNRCGIPSSATSVAVNLTVTQPSNPGFLTLYPGGQPRPLASFINYAPGQTRANNAILTLNPAGELAVFCGQGEGSTHFILDLSGYFQ
jgi:hypothetical protein